MKLRNITSALLLAGIAATAQAHTHLEHSVPADKSRVKTPEAVVLHFSEAARVTALTLQKGNEAPVAPKPLPTAATQHVSVPVTTLAAGDYVVNWRMVGDDGHVMSGKFGFTVDPNAPAAQAPAGNASAHHDHGAQKSGAAAGGHQH